jgi:hypothetical protein
MTDFNTAGPQKNFDVVPDGTIAVVRMAVRPGDAGPGGWLRRSNNGESEGLDCEFTVTDGEFAKRKFWSLFTLEGMTEGHSQAAEISATKLRAILESARGIRPDDQSDAAKAARQTASYGDFDGLLFIARIGVEPPKNGYKAKNVLDHVVTPDETAWHQVAQEPRPAPTPSAPSAKPATPAAKPATAPTKIPRPQWAGK